MFKFFLENKVRFALMFEWLKRKIKFVGFKFSSLYKKDNIGIKRKWVSGCCMTFICVEKLIDYLAKTVLWVFCCI